MSAKTIVLLLLALAVVLAVVLVVQASRLFAPPTCVDRVPPTPAPVPDPEPEPTAAVYYDVPLEPYLQDYVRNCCEEHDLDMPLVLAVIDKESGFDAGSVGDNGQSYGLMGVLASEWTDLCIDLGCWNLTDPIQNIRAGTAILAQMFDRYDGRVHLALMAYNGGEPYADDLIADGITSTKYTRWVTARAAEIEEDMYYEP